MSDDEAGLLSPARLMEEAARLLGTSLSEFVPPPAQVHLLNAQRELLLAIAVIVEHNSTRLTQRRPSSARDSGASRNGARTRRTPSRVELD